MERTQVRPHKQVNGCAKQTSEAGYSDPEFAALPGKGSQGEDKLMCLMRHTKRLSRKETKVTKHPRENICGVNVPVRCGKQQCMHPFPPCTHLLVECVEGSLCLQQQWLSSGQVPLTTGLLLHHLTSDSSTLVCLHLGSLILGIHLLLLNTDLQAEAKPYVESQCQQHGWLIQNTHHTSNMLVTCGILEAGIFLAWSNCMSRLLKPGVADVHRVPASLICIVVKCSAYHTKIKGLHLTEQTDHSSTMACPANINFSS